MHHRVWLVATLFLIVDEGLGGIAVRHKVRKNNDLVAEVPFEQILDYSDFEGKTTMVTAEPDDGCGDLNPPPAVKRESLDSRKHGNIRWTVILKHSNRCTWRSRVRRAQENGYVGIVAYLLNNEAEDEIRSITNWAEMIGLEMNVSVVSGDDAEILKKYSYPKPYTISIHKDISLMERLTEYLELKYNHFWRYISTWIPTWGTVILFTWTGLFLLVPGLIIMAAVKESKKPTKPRGQWTYYPNYDEPPQKPEQERRKEQNKTNKEKSEQKERRNEQNNNYQGENFSNVGGLGDFYMRLRIEGYRTMLGVPREATTKEVESAYRKKSREYHEDWTRRNGFTEKEIKTRTEILKTELPKAREALLKDCERQGR